MLSLRKFIHLLLFIVLLSVPQQAFAQSGADLVVHYVEGQPRTGEYAYDVAVYFSAFQANGESVRDLPVNNIAITEDGKKVSVTGLELTDADESINVAVAMDTSGSMRGTKIAAARQAAAQLISGLGQNDLAAVISFNSQVKTEIGFTNNLQDARKKVEELSAIENAGTCFYDALEEAVTLTATLPVGRRAIIILTDGVDELPTGGKCSHFREEDVINLAKSGGTRVPIYTIGLGKNVDAAGLQRIAESTGGRYEFASDEQKLQGLFGKLLNQLRSQYRAMYVSTGAPGPHQLVLEANINGQQFRQLRDFVLPNFAYSLLVNSPREGESITGKTMFNIQVIGQGEPIAKIEVLVNDQSIGVIEKMPYELEWTPEAGNTGEAKIDVIAFGENGKELARKTLKVSVNVNNVAASPVPSAVVMPTETPTTTNKGEISTTTIIVVAIIAILIIAAGVFFLITRNKQRKEQEMERQWRETVGGEDKTEVVSTMGEERTLDAFIASPDALGMLVVLESDDPVLKGQHFEITKTITTLGRKADNDLLFPKDSPVSRHHAIIEKRADGLYLREVIADDDGVPKRPVYGTFINSQQVEGDMRLKNCDEIRLGKRLLLRFESHEPVVDSEKTVELTNEGGEKTIDNWVVDNDKTI